ncbi:hypothetical protein Tco_1077029 [Tanacetum coccineum]
MVPPNMLRPDLNSKAINDTQYRANPKESHLIAVKRTFCTLSLGLRYPKRSGFALKGYSDSYCVGCNMDKKSTSVEVEDVVAVGCCANILWIKSQLVDYDIIYEKIKNHTLKRDIEFHFIPTQYQLADIFIKLLDKPSFKRLIDELEPFTRSPNMYKEYLAEFWYSAKALENSKVSFSVPTGGIYGKVGVNTFRNAVGAHYLPHSSEYVAPPSIDVVRQWFPTIGYGEEVSSKGTLRKSLIPPR